VLASFSDARITIRKANDLDDPVLTAPADGAHFKVNENITFTWKAVKGAKEYDFDMGMTCGREASGSTDGLDFDFFFGDDNIGQRSWKVKATNDDDESDWSERSLIVDKPASKSNDLDDPVLVYPDDGAHFKVNENITFTWNAVKGAKKYDWAIGMTGGREVSSTTNGLKFDFFFGDDNIGRRSWKVKATNGDDESDYTESYLYVDEPKSHPVRRFKTNDLDDPVLVAPEDGAHVKAEQNVTFSWNKVTGAKKYECHIGLSGGRTVIITEITSTKVEHSFPADSTGRRGWSVKAINGDDESDYTESYVYVDAPASHPVRLSKANDLDDPVLVYPDDGAHFKVNENITFKWNAVKGAKEYDWAIGMTGGRVVHSSTTGLSFDFFFGDDNIGRRSWKVKATNDDDESDYTESYLYVDDPKSHPVRRISTNDLDDPVLTAPADGTHFKVNENITFKWNAVKGAKEYDFRITMTGGREFYSTSAENKADFYFGDDNIGRRTWKVKAINGQEESDYSVSYLYVDQPASRKANDLDDPVLVAPDDGAHFKKTDNITFTWKKVTGASGYEYQCQLSGGRVVIITTDETTVYRDWHESNTGRYFWKVKGTKGEEESDFTQAYVNIDN
jgi:hypothetical protein